MRIALVQHAYHTNTAGIVFGLQSRGHEVLPIANIVVQSASAADFTRMEPVIVPYGPRSLRRFDSKNCSRRGVPKMLRLFRVLWKFRPDVVVAREVRPVSILVFIVAKLIRATPVLWLLKPKIKFGPRQLRRLTQHCLPRRRFHSGYSGNFGVDSPLPGNLGTSRFLGLPVPWTEIIDVRHRLEESDPRRVRLLSVASFGNPIKRIDWVLRAVHAAGLREEVDVTFVGFGDETLPVVVELRTLERELELPASDYLFNLPHCDIRRVLSEHDLLLHPALKEQFGAVIPEAMSHGLAVLCSDRAGAMACFKNGISGLTFDAFSFSEFTERLAKLVRDSEFRRSIQLAARLQVEQNLLPDIWAERFEEVLAT